MLCGFITARLRFESMMLSWIKELQKPGVIRADLLAGLTGAVVVLPQGVAFANLAGMPAQYGLYTAMVPCLVAALFGSSRQMVSGPANAISLTTLALVAPLAAAGSGRYIELVLMLTLMVGLFQLVLAGSGLARWVDKVPHSVIVGFTTGAAVLIANSQIGAFFGLDFPRGRGVLENLQALAAHLSEIRWPPTIIAMLTLLSCVVGRRLGWRIPYMLVAVLVGGLSYALGLYLMPELFVMKAVDALPSAIPPISIPSFNFGMMISLLVPALVMTLLALTEAMAIARAYALRSGQDLNTQQEIAAQGLSNIAGAFFSSYPSSGSFNRSGLNVEAGAKTPLAAMSASLMLILILLFVSPLARYLPIVSIAAILMMVAWTLIDFDYPKQVWKSDKLDFWSWLLTFLLTVSISLEWAIIGGLGFYFVGQYWMKALQKTQ
jgi:sulfate permease, SulP family